MRGAYFALKFFYENVFNEKLPLARKSLKLPLVLSREEICRMIKVTTNIKHKLVLMLLYYADLRLDEVRNLKCQDIDFDRGIIHVKTAKGKRKRLYSCIRN